MLYQPRAAPVAAGRGADLRRDGFWRGYLSLGFSILSAESAAAAVYLWTSPSGPSRGFLTTAVIAVLVVAMVGVALSQWVATRPWRVAFSFASGVVSVLTLSAFAALDGGLESPLMYLAVLPVFFAALALRPALVGAVAASTSAGLAFVGVTDKHRELPQESLFMLIAFVAGVTALAIVAAVHRTRLEAEDEALMRELADRAVTDALTGCANQRAFHERLAEEVARATRHRRALSLIICDVDLFKSFNDTYGHDVGDRLLAAIGARLRACARRADIVARIGGDEFAILMPETSLQDARAVTTRIMRATGGVSLEPTLSVGIATLDPLKPAPGQLLRDADQAMFDAKALGRGQAVEAKAAIHSPPVPVGRLGAPGQTVERSARSM